MNDYMKPDKIDLLLDLLETSNQRFLPSVKLGQQKVKRYDVLPRNAPIEQLKELGFTFGEIVDDLFIEATLPDGWIKEPTEHALHTHIKDNQGRIRANIFYKAAFYNRKARLTLFPAVEFGTEPTNGWGSETYDKEPFIGRVRLNKMVVYETAPTLNANRTEAFYNQENVLRSELKSWVEEHYPDYQNPLAYWD